MVSTLSVPFSTEPIEKIPIAHISSPVPLPVPLPVSTNDVSTEQKECKTDRGGKEYERRHESQKAKEGMKGREAKEGKEGKEGMKAKEGRESKHSIDPIVLGMEETVHMYNGASVRMKQQMECEEAQRIEGMLNELYKTQGGRSRGWTKAMLEEMIRPRCASGGFVPELDKSKKAFLWQIVGDEKVYSSFLDFLCVAKKIRVAIWFEEERRVILYPAADNTSCFLDEPVDIPLLHVSHTGHLLSSKPTKNELVSFCDSKQYILMPPLSVIHSLSGLTLTELESVGKQLGMATVEGSKKERIANIAIYKLRQRLS